MPAKFDLLVIGSGPGGKSAAIQAAKVGKRVGMIEKRAALGGVCINTGTIPSKTMREAVLHLSGLQMQNFYGMDYRVKEKITMQDLVFRVHRVIENEISVTNAQLQRNGVEVIHGTAGLLSANRVRIEGLHGSSELEADYIVIAVGTKPACSPKVPLNGRNIMDSDQILQMPEIPKIMIVVPFRGTLGETAGLVPVPIMMTPAS